MKPLIYNDILAAASCVSGADDPAAIMRGLIREAETAERHQRVSGRAHPVFGDGSLMAAALRHGRHGDARFASRQGRAAWTAALAALQLHLPQPDAQPMQRVTVGSNSSRFCAISSPQSSQ